MPLLFNGEDDGRPQMCGLLDMSTMSTSSIKTNASSTQRASNERGSSIAAIEVAPSARAASSVEDGKEVKNAQEQPKRKAS
jgi:hypothetical protein